MWPNWVGLNPGHHRKTILIPLVSKSFGNHSKLMWRIVVLIALNIRCLINPLLICTWFFKNQVRNRLKIQFIKLDFSKLIFQKSSIDQQGDRVTRSRAECPDGIFAKFTDKCVCTIMCPSPSPPPPSQFSLSHSAQAVQCCMCNRSHLVIWFLILH